MDHQDAMEDIGKIIAYAQRSPANLRRLVGTDRRTTRATLRKILGRNPTKEQVDAVFDFGEVQVRNVSSAMSELKWVN